MGDIEKVYLKNFDFFIFLFIHLFSYLHFLKFIFLNFYVLILFSFLFFSLSGTM